MSGLLASFAWCSLQVTLVALLAWLLCAVARRMSASHAAALPATALAAVIVLTALWREKGTGVVSPTDPLGNVTTTAYDNLQRRKTLTQPNPDAGGPFRSGLGPGSMAATGCWRP